jgi:hypothetical protein
MPDTEIWTKQDDETQRAYEVFCVYRDLGPSRRLIDAHDETYGHGAGNIRLLQRWSSQHDWVDRAEAYDQYLEAKRREEYEREMTTGLAHAGARVRELKEMYWRLKAEAEENLWLEDVKITPQGDVIPVQRYNSALVRNIQQTLDDIAKEVGGRKQQVDVTTQGQALDKGIDVQIEGAVPIIERAVSDDEDA